MREEEAPLTSVDGSSHEQLSLSVATSAAEVEQIRGAWESMQREPNADIDYFLTVVEQRDDVLRPHVIVVREREQIVALLVGRIEEDRFEIKIGAKTVLHPRVRKLSISYGGVMGDWTEGVSEHVFDELRRVTSEAGIDLVFFNHLTVDSPLHRVARTARGFLGGRTPEPTSVHWRVTIPNSYEEFEAGLSKTKRKGWRRYVRRFEQAFEDRIRVDYLHEVADLDQIMKDSEFVAEKSYHRGFGVGFMADEETRQRLKRSLEKGWLRVYLLYVDDVPRAFRHLQIYGRTIFAFGTSYDPEFRQYGLGNYLLIRALREFAGAPELDDLDFGFGDANHKRDICDKSWDEVSIHLFRPSFRGIRVYAARSLALALGQVLEATLRRTNLYERVKTFWRRRSESKSD